jgi:hypothetical protein
MLRAIIGIFLVSCVSGCITSITPPGTLKDPVTVYLTDEGIHSSVLLPVGGNKYMEYAKGDWNYAVMRHHWPWDVMGALFFSQQGAIGRRVVEVHAGPKVPKLPDARLNTLQVERARVAELLVQLEMRYLQGSDLQENPDTGLYFRRVPEPYSFFNNCNAMTKQSLEQLGCKVESRSPFAIYKVHSVQPVLLRDEQPVLVQASP